MKKLLLIGLLWTTPAYAEPLKIPLSVYAASAAADLATTYRFLQYEGFREGNPFGAWASDKPKTLMVYSAVSDAAILYGAHKLVNMKIFNGPHPRFEKIVLYGAAGVRFLYALDNYKAITPNSIRRR